VENDVVDVGLNLGLLTISVNGILKKLFGRHERGPCDIVAKRFLMLFGAHGVEVAQIPRLLPMIGLDALNTRESLLKALTCDVLDETASLFGVEREWLDGATEVLYPCQSCYKRPRLFFEDLGSVKTDGMEFPVRALYSDKTLSGGSERSQPVVLLLVEKIAEFGDKEIQRFRVYHDSWDWGHFPARIQLKAMARVVFLDKETPIPLYRVPYRRLELVRERKAVPRDLLAGSPLTSPSLEDFALSPEESAQSKEAEEIPVVMEYINKHGLVYGNRSTKDR
jgi:hypothetical protein